MEDKTYLMSEALTPQCDSIVSHVMRNKKHLQPFMEKMVRESIIEGLGYALNIIKAIEDETKNRRKIVV